MSIRSQAHFKVHAASLAAWLAKQARSSWWSVDGDPVLTERLSFPCPGDDLAVELRRLGKPLLLLAPVGNDQNADGRIIAERDLDGLAQTDQSKDRAFQFCWEDADPEVDWVLIEDAEAGERSVSSSSSSAK